MKHKRTVQEKPWRFPFRGEDVCVNAFTCVYVWQRLAGTRGEQKGEKGSGNLVERQNIKREEHYEVWQLILLTALWQAIDQIAHGCRHPTQPSFTPQQRVLINYRFTQGRNRAPLAQISALERNKWRVPVPFLPERREKRGWKSSLWGKDK